MKKLLWIIPLLMSIYLAAQDSLLISEKYLNEVSGIVTGLTNRSWQYVINDSGGEHAVYALNKNGRVVASLLVWRVANRDWEDIAVGPGPEAGKNYIYIGEIGDNDAKYKEYYLYRFEEPPIVMDKKSSHFLNYQVKFPEKLKFVYEDGAKDCEALFIDPANADVYIISKREKNVGLYQIKAPLDTLTIHVAKRIMSFDFPLAVAADISQQRDKILIKTYDTIYCWKVKPNQEIKDALSAKPEKLPYKMEPQGESVCWTADGKKYITLSEKDGSNPLYMYVYPYPETPK